ncbi:histidinol-phosphate transaminase, partial [bacterium]|nr:histidinol-phosphate transaminase [bacterium]
MPTQIRKAIKGLSAYKAGKPIDEVKRELGLSSVVKLASNENPFGPSPKALEAISSSLAEINRYPEGSCFYLREALSKKLRVDPESLIF